MGPSCSYWWSASLCIVISFQFVKCILFLFVVFRFKLVWSALLFGFHGSWRLSCLQGRLNEQGMETTCIWSNLSLQALFHFVNVIRCRFILCVGFPNCQILESEGRCYRLEWQFVCRRYRCVLLSIGHVWFCSYLFFLFHVFILHFFMFWICWLFFLVSVLEELFCFIICRSLSAAIRFAFPFRFCWRFLFVSFFALPVFVPLRYWLFNFSMGEIFVSISTFLV